jgi:predicted transcriptional regulator
MRERKLFIGSGIRRLREARGQTQVDFASKLRISTAYLSQMETNQRPVSAAVLYGLTTAFGVDINDLVSEDPDRLGADLKEALSDPVFLDRGISNIDIQTLAISAPWLAQRFLHLHSAYRRVLEEAEGLAEPGLRVQGSDRARDVARRLPFEEVRDFFLYNNNYFDELDRAGEDFATRLDAEPHNLGPALASYCERKLGLRMRLLDIDDERYRSYDTDAKVLAIHPALLTSERTFQILCQIGWIEHGSAIRQMVSAAKFKSREAEAIAESALVNYVAAAVMLPYRRFAKAAIETRHDLLFLARMFSASLEQVCHRLSTLQRSGDKGVPVYFLKVDRAGTIVKRHNANRFQFPRFGGACPLWNVYQAFEQPDRILVQKAEMPDGTQFLCLATSVTKASHRQGTVVQRHALGMGCELNDARHFIYADQLDLAAAREATPIGVSCRVCPRQACAHRAVPPTNAEISVNPNERAIAPYAIS